MNDNTNNWAPKSEEGIASLYSVIICIYGTRHNPTLMGQDSYKQPRNKVHVWM